MIEVVVAVLAGALIGLSLGALGSGGSILAVPVLVTLLDQSPLQATTGSLVVVGVSALIGAVGAARQGNVLLARGVAFGAVATGGAVLGAAVSVRIDEDLLLALFAGLLLVVAGLMVVRDVKGRGTAEPERRDSDATIIQVSPTFACNCPRALKVLLTATAVGLLTGFFGVGGGFLVVPALVLALGLSARSAAGTSLVVIAITSAVALATRAGAGAAPDWTLVAVLTVAAALGALVGSRIASRTDTRRLARAFEGLIVLVAIGMAAVALPALL